jgi:hypothetical protein
MLKIAEKFDRAVQKKQAGVPSSPEMGGVKYETA